MKLTEMSAERSRGLGDVYKRQISRLRDFR